MPIRTVAEKQKFIEDHLYHELRCLLGAATICEALKKHDAGHDVSVAMDSAMLHARSLFKFFTEGEGGDDVSIESFVGRTYRSPVYTNDWANRMNRHLFHLAYGRKNPTNMNKGKALNAQPINFSKEILRLWNEFEKDPKATDFISQLKVAKERSIEDAANDAQMKLRPINPIF